MNRFLLIALGVLFVLAVEVQGATLNNIWDTSGEATTMGEKLSPLQAPLMPSKQVQAPIFQAQVQKSIQAPSKLVSLRSNRACTILPGRAVRLARREARAAVRAQALSGGHTLLENSFVSTPATGRTMLEGDGGRSCSSGSCNSGSVALTALTTRELLEGGALPRGRGVVVQEPGVCGSGGSCDSGGGRRGIFRRR